MIGNRTTLCLIGLVVFAWNIGLCADGDKGGDAEFYRALGAPAEREVEVSWNRFHDHAGMTKILSRIHEAFPHLTRLYSIGNSYEGREIWCLEVTNQETGKAESKAGMYIDGNIHGNEVQAGEVVLYTGWYLCELYGEVEFITNLVDKRVFYLIPTINPDGRDHWFHTANTAHSSRTGRVPLDNDRDGVVDEDGYDDLDGNGSITRMRIKDPNGRWKPHPDFPEYLMVRVEPDERGEYTDLGWEGIDNDGDGRINEDGPGGYDSNRNWAWDWQPNYVQYGAHDYPFSLPNTRAVAEFVIAHPNIAGMQSYHNSGGMILRTPGREGGEVQPQDDRILRDIAERGERMLPFYRSFVLWRDLYTVWGGEFDWFYGARGILSFSNELWTLRNMYRNNDTGDTATAEFLRYLLQNQGVVVWKEYDHPTYGKIEIGGTTKEWSRVPPSFLLEEECHRNMAFTLYHADAMPLISFGEINIETLDENLYRIWVEIRNDRMMPTRTAQDLKHNIFPPDIVRLEGDDLKILSSGRVTDRFRKIVEPVKVRPQRVEVDTIPGLDSVRVQFIAEGKGEATICVNSQKGGDLRREIQLE